MNNEPCSKKTTKDNGNANRKLNDILPTSDIDKKQDDDENIDDGEKANIQEFLEHIWELYDVDKNGYVDAEEASYMLEDLSGLKTSTQ